MDKKYYILTMILILLPFAAYSAEENESQSQSVMRRGPYRLSQGVEVKDLVTSGGPVEVNGVVKGSIFAIDCIVTVSSSGIVEGNITVIGGLLILKNGARINGDILAIDGRLQRDENSIVKGKIDSRSDGISNKSKFLLRQYLIFERPIPDANTPEEAISQLKRSFHHWEFSNISTWTAAAVENLPAVPFPDNAAAPAKIGVWVGHDKEITVGAARFADSAEAKEFWKKIRAAWPEKDVSGSVHVSLGDGMHWYFVRGDRAVVIWTKDNWFMSVTVAPLPGEREPENILQFARDAAVRQITRIWNKDKLK